MRGECLSLLPVGSELLKVSLVLVGKSTPKHVLWFIAVASSFPLGYSCAQLYLCHQRQNFLNRSSVFIKFTALVICRYCGIWPCFPPCGLAKQQHHLSTIWFLTKSGFTSNLNSLILSKAQAHCSNNNPCFLSLHCITRGRKLSNWASCCDLEQGLQGWEKAYVAPLLCSQDKEGPPGPQRKCKSRSGFN